jgi:hypothetical protein
MKRDTFYVIISDSGQVMSGTYAADEYEVAKKRLVELAEKNSGQRMSLMKRINSVTSGLVWEDSI